MTDFNKPTTSDLYEEVLQILRDRDVDAAKWFDGTAESNIQDKFKRWSDGPARFEKWNAALGAWEELATLYGIKVNDSDKLNGQQAAYYLNAGNLNAGTVPSARFDDTSHGNRSGGTLHANASTTVAGFMSAADKSKLNGIESGATADMTASEILAQLLTVDGATSGLDSDLVDGYHAASLLARSNHTGTQPFSTLSGDITQAQLGSATVGQGQLKTAQGSVTKAASGSLAMPAEGLIGNMSTPGGQYTFWPESYVYVSDTSSGAAYYDAVISVLNINHQLVDTTYTLAYDVRAYLKIQAFHSVTGEATARSGTFELTARQRYVQASPPYDLGDGHIGQFIFVAVNKDGTPDMIYSAPEAPWHLNGPTNTMAHYYDKQGRGWRREKGRKWELVDGVLVPVDVKPQLIEVTQEMKQRDMPLIPHPFLGNDLSDKTVILLDPVCDLAWALAELHENGESPNSLIVKNMIKFDNNELRRNGPPGVKVVPFKWKNTAGR